LTPFFIIFGGDSSISYILCSFDVNPLYTMHGSYD
jgi:hypothetical protein